MDFIPAPLTHTDLGLYHFLFAEHLQVPLIHVNRLGLQTLSLPHDSPYVS